MTLNAKAGRESRIAPRDEADSGSEVVHVWSTSLVKRLVLCCCMAHALPQRDFRDHCQRHMDNHSPHSVHGDIGEMREVNLPVKR